jgi:hypothetical protein
MTIAVRWVRIQPETFHMIYNNLGEALHVHGSYTRMGGHDGDVEERRMDTEWGFKDAAVGLIRSECRGDRWSFYIAEVRNEE